MDRQGPIYTEKSRCQDCYKCVRNCPVKAIVIKEGAASVQPDLCILCGTCVQVCPRNAKTVRFDIPAAQKLLENKEKVYAALAPSYVSEFPEIPARALVEGLKQLGFAGVSETALGAEEVSAGVGEVLKEEEGRVLISSSCPVVVEYVKRYLPDYGDWVADMLSPVLAQCRLLRKEFGEGIGIVFIGPCIAKKREADSFPDLLDTAITFNELRLWLGLKGVSLDKLAVESAAGREAAPVDFVPRRAREGALYPVDGGMTAGIKANCPVHDISFMNFSGIENIREALLGLDLKAVKTNLFLEFLACDGGCVNGPGCTTLGATVNKRLNVLTTADVPEVITPRKPAVDIAMVRDCGGPPPKAAFTPEEIRGALESVGKYTAQDELDCSGCGYDSCRDFAAALLMEKAEPTMCVSYTRQIAQREANRLLAAMPSAAAIVGADLKVVDCNRRFAAFLGEEMEDLFEEGISLKGVQLEKFLPFAELFRQVLKTDKEITDQDERLGEAVLNVTIFPVESGKVVGCIFQDITEPVVQKERVINRAREVIRRNLSMTQQIAGLLGENAADSEAILNSIIHTFRTPNNVSSNKPVKDKADIDDKPK